MAKSNISKLKNSFHPIANKEINILILGSLPGEKSLEMQQYYAHPQNRFWKVIAQITNSKFPINYEEKMSLLRENKIGVWDVVHSAKRSGSLDINIMDEIPNDLESFIANHPKLKIIAFNGSKSQKLYDKYFKRNPTIKYLPLPSTSPANAAYNFERLCKSWIQILL